MSTICTHRAKYTKTIISLFVCLLFVLQIFIAGNLEPLSARTPTPTLQIRHYLHRQQFLPTNTYGRIRSHSSHAHSHTTQMYLFMYRYKRQKAFLFSCSTAESHGQRNAISLAVSAFKHSFIVAPPFESIVLGAPMLLSVHMRMCMCLCLNMLVDCSTRITCYLYVFRHQLLQYSFNAIVIGCELFNKAHIQTHTQTHTYTLQLYTSYNKCACVRFLQLAACISQKCCLQAGANFSVTCVQVAILMLCCMFALHSYKYVMQNADCVVAVIWHAKGMFPIAPANEMPSLASLSLSLTDTAISTKLSQILCRCVYTARKCHLETPKDIY